MNTIKTTFGDLWNMGLKADAKSLGVIDGDLPVVRSKVKALFISAGWAQPDGTIEFVSDVDCVNALQAAKRELSKVAERVAAQRKVVRIQPGSTPTKAAVLSGSVVDEKSVWGPQTATLTSTQTVSAGSFSPKPAQVGDKCPRCHGSMQPVALANNQGALYCLGDRVVVPLSADTQVRY